MDVTYVNHVVGQSVIKMQYTTNYNLKKPESGDDVTPTPFNDNADTIDSKLKEANDSITGINNSISSINKSINGINDSISSINDKVKNITISTAEPSGGSDGDIWIKYS